jgi:hypothetical protein
MLGDRRGSEFRDPRDGGLQHRWKHRRHQDIQLAPDHLWHMQLSIRLGDVGLLSAHSWLVLLELFSGAASAVPPSARAGCIGGAPVRPCEPLLRRCCPSLRGHAVLRAARRNHDPAAGDEANSSRKMEWTIESRQAPRVNRCPRMVPSSIIPAACIVRADA